MNLNMKSLALLSLLTTTALAQAAWPDKPIKLVVPYPPGGSVDMIARQYAEYLQNELQQTVVVENKGGAATNIGSSLVAKAKPDGYTILLGTEALAINTAMGPVPNFNVVKDLAPISMLTRIPSIVAAHPSFAASTPSELVRLAREKPAEYSIGSASLFLQVAYLESGTKSQLKHIPYKGGAQASADAMGNQVNMVLASIPVIHPLITAGKLKPIAITGVERSKSLPDVPTFAEAGFKEATFSSWYAVFSPAGTPSDIVLKLNTATLKFTQDTKVKERLEPLGYQFESSKPQELHAQLKSNVLHVQKFVNVSTALLER